MNRPSTLSGDTLGLAQQPNNMPPSFAEMFRRLRYASGQSRTARTVELFGWLIFLESPIMILAPQLAVSLLHIPALEPQATNYFRLLGLLVGGIGMLYIVSGRMNSRGFAFASLLDRPLVPPIMFLLWMYEVVPGPLALIFSLQDAGSFLWTLLTWRAERLPATPSPTPLPS